MLAFAKSLNPFSVKVAPPAHTCASSPQCASADFERQPQANKKRQFEDITPSIEIDDSEYFPNVRTNARKRRAIQRVDKCAEHELAGPTIQQNGRDTEKGTQAAQETDDSIRETIALRTSTATSQEDDDEGDDEELGDAEVDSEDGEIIETEEGDWEEESFITNDEAKDEQSDSSTDNGSSDLSFEQQYAGLPMYDSTGNPPSSYSDQATPHRSPTKKRPDWQSPQSLAKEKVRREGDIAFQTVGWPFADAKLFRALELRGLQPIISADWMRDFPALPLALFTGDEERILVKALGLRANYARDVHGAHALIDLMSIGQQVRDRISDPYQSPGETYIKKAVNRYLRWTLTDADIWRRRPYLPLMVVVAGPKNTSPMALQSRLVKRMQKLKRKWIHALAEDEDSSCPPIYGVMVCHSVAAIMAAANGRDFVEEEDDDYEVNGIKDSIKLLTTMDWGDDGQDVWNAFALAILGVHCRDLLLQALEGRVLRGVTVDGAADGDPDA